ncbi:hypothetical protein ACKKBF_B37985 [Auxenochlorella protothecoides x Auxenochlorella symbiontica]
MVDRAPSSSVPIADDCRLHGNAAFKLHRYEEATAFFTRGLESLGCSPENSQDGSSLRQTLLCNRALAWYKLGEWEESLQDARASLALATDPAAVQKAAFRCAAACLMAGRDTEAAEHAARLGGLVPDGRGPGLLTARLEALAHARASAGPTGAMEADLQGQVAALESDLDGGEDEDVDVAAVLGFVRDCLARAPFLLAAVPRLQAHLLALLPSHALLVSAALEACAAGAHVLWPLSLFDRLAVIGCQSGDGQAEPGAAALQLLAWSAAKDPWVAGQVIAAPLAGRGSRSAAARVVLALEDAAWVAGARAPTLLAALAFVEAAAAAGAEALLATGGRPLQTLVGLWDLAAAAAATVAQAEEACSPAELAAEVALPAAEREALRELRGKRAAVFDPRLVRVRHATLRALRAVVGHRGLVRAELPAVPGLLDVVKSLHAASPQRMTRVSGPDGSPGSYQKRRYAADYTDNPAGDYLLTLDLPGSEGLPEGPTLLESALGTLGLLVRTSCEAAQALAGAGAVPLLRDLLEYSSPEVVESASRLCAALCARSKAARREVLESASSALLGCALAAADDPGLVGEAARRLAVIVGDCPPADLVALTAERGALWTALRACQAKTGGGDAPDSAAIVSTFSKVLALVRGCLDRAQCTQRLAPRQWPRGPGWDAVPREVRTLVLPPPAAGKDTQPLAFPTLPKGFLRRDGKAEERPVGQASSYKNSSVTIQELEATAPPTPDAQSPGDTHSEASAQTRCADDAHGPECLPDLRTVYDSTPLDAATRRARSAWLAKPEDSRVSWSQTSTDVSCLISLPQGTRAAEVRVRFAPLRLAADLRWYGKLLDAELWAGVKATDATWCLEDAELHILLPKAAPGWWKALLRGGAERTYHELLHEAVHADEPVTAYDELTDDSKDLIDSIRERQAYIAAGMLDPKGFDDFRVVIGENSLRG